MAIIDSLLKSLFGSKSERDIRKVQPLVEKINAIYKELALLSNDDLRYETTKLKEQIKEYVKEEQAEVDRIKEMVENDDDIDFDQKEEYYQTIDKMEEDIDEKLEEILEEVLPRAFAVVKETARRFVENKELKVKATDFDKDLAARFNNVVIKDDHAYYQNTWMAGGTEITWDMVHYDVQLIGGVILHQGKIAEMATGEGKTLVATLPVYLNALTGRGVHLVTVNNYLAKRDSEWMGPIFQFHQLSVDCIDKHEPHSEERRQAYKADITYGTNNEFGFDYLRDNMSLSADSMVQRKHNYSIVDEVDSVLIDDARTPLIISGPIEKEDKELFSTLKSKVIKLYNEQKKLVSDILVEAKKLIKQGDTKKGGVLLLRAFKGLPKNKPIIKFLSQEGMKSLMLKTEDVYLAENAKRMPEITEELYFVIDEKHNSVELTDKGTELISKDTKDPNFFIMPDIGSEVAEIEKSDMPLTDKVSKKDEVLNDYAIKSERIHAINQLLKAYTLFEKDVEYVVMDNKVKIVDEQTGRIMEGRRYSDGLHQAIEAKENVKVEAATQTLATVTLQNYFRMYHKLAGMTGTAETEAGEFMDIYELDVTVAPTNKPIVRDDREDLVYRTRREKYNAVIDEIVELVELGRPVLVGTTAVDVSELLSRMLKIKRIKHSVLNAKLHQKEADIVAHAGKPGTVTIATNMAGRGTDIKITKTVKEAGGLAIVGTERHESRRIDRQLRGRAGRQGDPGSSQFFVSLEDDLMRMFGSERIAKVMDRLGLEEGEVIQHSMITKSIERAQRKVEENNFGIRKRLLEYDDVMNKQREVIYKKRKNALLGERLGVDVANMMYDACESIVNEYHGIAAFSDFDFEVIRVLSMQTPINESEFIKLNPDEIIEKLHQQLIKTFKRKAETIAKHIFPVIENVHKNKSHSDILIRISDGKNVFPIIVNLEKAYKNNGKEVIKSLEKTIVLRTIDEIWKEHLREMDDLKQSVQNVTYEQKDPLLIYKFESFELFKQLVDRMNKKVVSTIMKAQIYTEKEEDVEEAKARRLDLTKLKTTRSDMPSAKQRSTTSSQQKVTTIRRTEKKVGRNDPCPCGSGKKYKHCHGRKGK